MSSLILRTLSLVLLLTPVSADAEWIAGGIPLTTKDLQQSRAQVVADGEGGVIVVWDDLDGRDIYAQRVDQNGNVLWTPGGVPVCACIGDQTSPRAISDGNGGAIITWTGNESGEAIVAARIDADGNVLWSSMVSTSVFISAGGTEYDVAADASAYPREYDIAPDGLGGIIFAWGGVNIVAQRLNSDGQLQWSEVYPGGGHAVCLAIENQFAPHIVPDGDGGAIIGWADKRRTDFFEVHTDTYMQRLDKFGTAQLAIDGIPLITDISSHDFAPGTGGDAALVLGGLDPPTIDVWARRFDASGNFEWPWVAVCNAQGEQTGVYMVSDGDDGFLVIWRDSRNGNIDAYAQRLAPDGSAVWPENGVVLAEGPGDQLGSDPVADGEGGLISIVGGYCCGSLRVQRIDPTGQRPWGNQGVFLNENSIQLDASVALAGDGGVYCAWSDYRNGNWDVYLQRFDIQTGQFGGPLTVAITSFEAESRAGHVVLRAAFSPTLAIERVNVYRTGENGTQHLLTSVEPNFPDHFEFVDDDVVPEKTYQYQLGVVDGDGEFLSAVESVTIPRPAFALAQNQPNPFNPTTSIRFTLAQRARASIVVYDAEGRRVRTLFDGMEDAGEHFVEWNGRDANGAIAGSGVFFYRLTVGKQTETKKMVLLK